MVGTFFNHALEVKPRFEFDILVGQITRYAGFDYSPWEEAVQILHVNMSGVALAIPEDLSPLAQEWIHFKLGSQFYLGQVVHIQTLSGGFIGVVIQNMGLSMADKFLLQQSLNERLKEQARPIVQKFDNSIHQLKKIRWQVLALILFWVISFLFLGIYLLVGG